MLLLGLLAAMMLAASPVLAHKGGPTHGNKYSKNYYPNRYFKYCEPDGSNYSQTKASQNSRCNKYYKADNETTVSGEDWYALHDNSNWKTPDCMTDKWG